MGQRPLVQRAELWVGLIGGILAIVELAPLILPDDDPTAAPGETAAAVAPTDGPTEDPTQAAVRQAIVDAHNVWVAAKQNVDTSQLSTVYAGDALQERTRAIEQLAGGSGCYEDTVEEQAPTYNITISGETTARAQVERIESTFRYCGSDNRLSNQGTAENDRYQITYFLERQNGEWIVVGFTESDLAD